MHPATKEILQYFKYDHLPPHLRAAVTHALKEEN